MSDDETVWVMPSHNGRRRMHSRADCTYLERGDNDPVDKDRGVLPWHEECQHCFDDEPATRDRAVELGGER